MENKEFFNAVITLIARQPWVGSKVAELSHMLYEECKCARSREMLIQIISNFFYLSSSDYSEKLTALAREVMSVENYAENTQIVAMAADSGTDSSQEIVYNLKYIFTKEGWNGFLGVSSFGAAYKTYKRSGRNKIVVVDDFVGSGQTVISRYNELMRVFTQNNVENFSITFKVLVSTQHGLKAARDAGIEITAQHEIKKAIDDCYPEELAREYRSLMTALEAGLSQEHGKIKLPSLGYNGAQAAYCREQANTPNSVFPVFWWPINSELKKRSTVLHRAMEDA
ncbi:hypothetical protein [Pseudomonas sp. T8]|uniref:phosphoribosyltransferase-like protein n=1 Tax=Pseudomonas sp. T8 TaxID=645292 RepID=UPI0021487FD2|nr:hypothetical protein [Pseudomonas sp. T8]UUT24092.1 hypothetical protein NRG23_09050 [Pseudomonas sp. T8]